MSDSPFPADSCRFPPHGENTLPQWRGAIPAAAARGVWGEQRAHYLAGKVRPRAVFLAALFPRRVFP